jgi:predicted Rossmann fold flavoprotein
MQVNTLILGAGAAGLFCAGLAGPDVLVVDHAAAPAEKVRISGGGRCNFTNLGTGPGNFLSANPHFAKSALARFRPVDFLALVQAQGIAWHEKTLGQLFCDGSARQIVALLMDMATRAGGQVWLNTALSDIRHDGQFHVDLTRDSRTQTVTARNLVVATGGKSIPKMGATGVAYDIARQFGHGVTETRAGLVPLTFADAPFAPLSGLSLPVLASTGRTGFAESMLFTHRGLSGPAILQLSNYWREGQPITLDLSPHRALTPVLQQARTATGKRTVATVLAHHLPARLVGHLDMPALATPVGGLSDAAIARLSDALHGWSLRPTGTEGYRTAEVTLGGVDTGAMSARTMESGHLPGLFFIGECVDVTGWLGGYNFQWAWASAHAAGTAIRDRG